MPNVITLASPCHCRQHRHWPGKERDTRKGRWRERHTNAYGTAFNRKREEVGDERTNTQRRHNISPQKQTENVKARNITITISNHTESTQANRHDQTTHNTTPAKNHRNNTK